MKKHTIVVALLALVLRPTLAQTDESLMPEGSTDLSIGASYGSGPRHPGSALRSAYLVPHFSVEWSNGVFVEGLALGMKLSRDPLLQYGTVIGLNLGAQHADGSKAGIRPVFGGFVNYQPMRELLLHAHLVGPGGRDRSGVLLNLMAGTSTWLAPRHSLGVNAGVNFMNSAGMQSDFGNAQYRPSGGARDAFAEARWQWQFSRKYTVTTAVRANRLLGDAGASPRTSQRTGIANSLTLQYSY